MHDHIVLSEVISSLVTLSSSFMKWGVLLKCKKDLQGHLPSEEIVVDDYGHFSYHQSRSTEAIFPDISW